MPADTTTPTTNPVKAARERHGLSRVAFARASGCPYHVIALAELGYPARIPKPVARALAAIGESADDLADQYEVWRAAGRPVSG